MMAKEKSQTFMQVLARIGYSARGVIYLIVGGLAFMSAVGEGGQTTDSRGAVLEILSQPFGRVLLVIQILGLIGYVVWRVTQSLADADRHGRTFKGISVRAGLLGSAVAYSFLALWATRLLFSQAGSGSDGQGQAFLATAPGQLTLAMAGVILLGIGLAHLYKGWTARFERYMDIPDSASTWARPLCQFGLMARGVVWLLAGWFLIDSVRKATGTEIKGMSEALGRLQDSPYGAWLLGIVAAGLVAFGLYSFIEAAFRRVGMDGSS